MTPAPRMAKPAARAAELTVALVGPPNCGKSTLFNLLTGLRQRVANYPGITVEKRIGRTRVGDGELSQDYNLAPNAEELAKKLAG